MAEDVLLVLTTWPDAESARKAARLFLDERLVACGNLLPGMESIYRWQGEIAMATETLLLLKTTRHRYDHLERKIREIHPYELPEILAFRAHEGLHTYLQWVETHCVPEAK